MLDYKSRIKGVPTINLIGEEVVLHYPPLKSNIAQDPEDDLHAPTTALGHSSHQHTVSDASFSSVAPSHTGPGGAPAMSSASVLRNIPTASLVISKQGFSPNSIDRLKSQTLLKVGTEEATTYFNAHASQDVASYDGYISEVYKEDVEVIPDEVDDAQMEGLKPVGANTVTNNEGQEVTNKEDNGQTSKPADKKPI